MSPEWYKAKDIMIVDGYGQSADPNALWKRVDLAICVRMM